ncbi:MAG: hypothetical protein V1886_00940 [archaeon]
MSKNILLGFLFAILLVSASFAVYAAELASNVSVRVDNTVVDSKTISVTAGQSFDVEVSFTAVVDDKDVVVKVWTEEGYKEEILEKSGRFDVVSGRTYTKKLTIALPIDFDVAEDSKLVVRIAGKNRADEQDYQLTVQRPAYELEILSASFVREVKAGDTLQINAVIKNRGSKKVEDNFVKARISELGLTSREVYAGDLVAVDCDDDDCEKEDTVEKTVSISIPKGTESGTYKVVIEAYNDESTASVSDSVIVKGVDEQVSMEILATSEQLKKEVAIGGKETYRIEIFNPSDEAKTVTITTPAALEAQGVKVTTTPSVITVPADSSQVVEVQVEASGETTTGSYNVPLTITSAEDDTTKEVGITANVVKAKSAGTSKSALTLSVVLGIMFVVLMIVLFVTVRKPKEMGEEETAYY